MTNETNFTNFKRDIQTLNYAELNYLISDIMLEIKKRAYNEGMVKAMTSAEEVAPKSPQRIRDEIIEGAKRDVTELEKTYHENVSNDWEPYDPELDFVEFAVNQNKRTVVALIKYRKEKTVWSKGIAKCDSTDCFNVHIGKAIALRRALGLEVPTEYLNAPQPEEVRIGDVVTGNQDDGFYKKSRRFTLTEINEIDGGYRYAEDEGDWIEERQIGKIIDDSREGGEA